MRSSTKQLLAVAEKAVKIRCRYCDLKDTCEKRAHKESYENQGITSYCSLTPNRPGKKKKKKKSKKK